MKKEKDKKFIRSSFSSLLINSHSESRVLLFTVQKSSQQIKKIIEAHLTGITYHEAFDILSLQEQFFDLIILLDNQRFLNTDKMTDLCDELTKYLTTNGRLLYLCSGKDNMAGRLKSLFNSSKLHNRPQISKKKDWNGYAEFQKNLELSHIVKAESNSLISQNEHSRQVNLGIIGSSPFGMEFTSLDFVDPEIDMSATMGWHDWQLVSNGTGAANNKSVFKTQNTTHNYFLKFAYDEAGIWFLKQEYQNLDKFTSLCDSNLLMNVSTPVAYTSKKNEIGISIQKSPIIDLKEKPSIDVICKWLSNVAIAFRIHSGKKNVEKVKAVENHMIKSPANDYFEFFIRLEKKIVIELESWINERKEVVWGLTLVHGDFVPGNIIAMDAKELLIIDWECANWYGEPGIDLLNYFIYSAIENNKDPVSIIKKIILNPSDEIKINFINYFNNIGYHLTSFGFVVLSWALFRLRVKESMKNNIFNPESVYEVTQWILDNKEYIYSRWDLRD